MSVICNVDSFGQLDVSGNLQGLIKKYIYLFGLGKCSLHWFEYVIGIKESSPYFKYTPEMDE